MNGEGHKLREAGNDRWGQLRLVLSTFVIHILNKHAVDPWFLDSGTLLGAHRSHTLIKSDDDFDLGLFIRENGVAELERLCTIFNEELPSKYRARHITTYTDKLEIYEPGQGNYTLKGERYAGADFHYVTVDLQLYAEHNGSVHASYRAVEPPTHSLETLFPLRQVRLLNRIYPAPHDTHRFLKDWYGSIREGARYDESSGRYLSPT